MSSILYLWWSSRIICEARKVCYILNGSNGSIPLIYVAHLVISCVAHSVW